MAPAPPAERYPPNRVKRIVQSESGGPARYMAVTVVNNKRATTLGLVNEA
jgi:hypothetical protein